jgi:carotenoid cleavage dioxygenase-like enzyme
MTTIAQPTESDTRLGFTTLDEELAPRELPLRGGLPDWLGGTLVRVTPALLDPGGRPVRHWFDGLAMLNAFTLGDGSVSYASRFLESRELAHVREHGETTGMGFATDPCRSLFRRVATLFSPQATDNCNVNVTRLGERWIAMTETPVAIEFDPDTLATLGPVEWANGLGEHAATAHPHHDPARGELVSYVIHFSRTSSYRVFAVADGSRERRPIGTVNAREPAYMHSFGLTDRYAVLFEQPLVVNPLRLALGGKSFIESFEWKPERGTRFLVIDRERGELRAAVDADAFFTFHHVNAFEDDGELVVDLVAYDDASVIDRLYLDRLRERGLTGAAGELRRYRLPLDGGRASYEPLSDERLELPRIAYRSRNGRPYRFVYANSQLPGSESLEQIVKIDVRDGSARHWREHGCYPGEPVFVPAPGAGAEDDGVVLSVVLDAPRRRSFLLVLDARDLGELARAEAPHHIPLGFHGAFASDAA